MHGATAGAPRENVNAVTHGAFADLAAHQIGDSLFGAISSDPSLEAEMRIARYKLLRLLEPSLIQNIVAGYNVEQIEADELTKITGMTHLLSEIRKLAKEMQSTDSADAVRDFLSGVDTVRKMQAEDLSE